MTAKLRLSIQATSGTYIDENQKGLSMSCFSSTYLPSVKPRESCSDLRLLNEGDEPRAPSVEVLDWVKAKCAEDSLEAAGTLARYRLHLDVEVAHIRLGVVPDAL